MTKNNQQLTRKIAILEDPFRLASLPAEKILQYLEITKSFDALDLGAGTGYLSIPVAKQIDGVVFALDLDKDILDYLQAKAEQNNVKNIEVVEGNFTNIPLSSSSVDIALASLSLHEIKPLSSALQEIHRVLKDKGIFLCVEFEPIEETSKPRVPSLKMEEELTQAGFIVKEKIYPNAKMLEQDLYIMIAEK